jgi:cytochrome c
MTRISLIVPMMLAFAIALAFAGTANAQDGAALYTSKGCPACHGPEGGKPLGPGYPRTRGQDETYIINQIKAFKSGQRKGGQSALMIPMAQTLSDAEATAIAKYLASFAGK